MAITYTQFVDIWIGKKVDYDGVFQYQCVDLIKQYIKDITDKEPGVFGGSAIAGYESGSPFAGISRWVKITRTADKVPRQGDVIFRGPSATNSYGHVAIVDSLQGSKVLVLEQNGVGGGDGQGGNAIRRKDYLLKNTIGRYRYIPPLSPSQQKTVDSALTSNSALWKMTSDLALRDALKQANSLIREIYGK